ncbi:MAG: hypothetical protein QF570_19165 [Myxococcota bacterium]|nr:hypothetical protein [Myxococcota bacterium]
MPIGEPYPDMEVLVVDEELREETSVDTTAALGRAKERLPNYMAPRSIETIDDFPLNANGKVDRNALRGQLRDAAKK